MDMLRTKVEARADLNAAIDLLADATSDDDRTYLKNAREWFIRELNDPCPWVRLVNF